MYNVKCFNYIKFVSVQAQLFFYYSVIVTKNSSKNICCKSNKRSFAIKVYRRILYYIINQAEYYYVPIYMEGRKIICIQNI